MSSNNAYPASNSPASEPHAPLSRSRSTPNRATIVRTVILSSAHYMGILVALTVIATFFYQPSQLASRLLVFSLAFTGISWFVCYLKRGSTHCALCKGTPFINTGAHVHQKAVRWLPFNHGVTATLSIIATQKFRCMYCGTEFDLLKTPSHRLSADPNRPDYVAYTNEDDRN